LPNWRGNGMLGLLADTLALARQGTTRTADKAATVSSFMEKASRGLVLVALSPTYSEP
jgi:hypothetical protein